MTLRTGASVGSVLGMVKGHALGAAAATGWPEFGGGVVVGGTVEVTADVAGTEGNGVSTVGA